MNDNVLLVIIGVFGFIVASVAWELGKRLFGRRPAGAESQPGRGPATVCSNPHCRTLNVTRARYCPRCGTDLHPGS